MSFYKFDINEAKDNGKYSLLPAIINQLSVGAFLTTKVGTKTNTMTIGWLTIGKVWSIDVATVYVRFSRYTYDLITNTDFFTISVPLPDDKLSEIELWGTKSGRDIAKLSMENVSAAKSVEGIVIKGCYIHIECEKIYNQIMEPHHLDAELYNQFYSDDGDYHHIFYGRIKDLYIEGK